MERLGKNVRFRPPKWLEKKEYEEGLDMALIWLGYVVVVSITVLIRICILGMHSMDFFSAYTDNRYLPASCS